MKNVDSPVAVDFVALRGCRRHAVEVRRGFEQWLRDGPQHSSLVGILGLARIKGLRLVIELHAQGLVLRQARALRQRRGVAGRADDRHECRESDGTTEPRAWGHGSIIPDKQEGATLAGAPCARTLTLTQNGAIVWIQEEGGAARATPPHLVYTDSVSRSIGSSSRIRAACSRCFL